MTIDVDLILARLFGDPTVRARILRDYGITAEATTPAEFGELLLEAIGQRPRLSPFDRVVSNSDVFQAAVRALGSNSRSWATFLKSEPALRRLLRDYDPIRANRAFEQAETHVDEIKACLPGQSSSADARAVRAWARLLTDIPDFYSFIVRLASAIQHQSRSCYGNTLQEDDLLLCLVGFLAYPPSKWAGTNSLSMADKRTLLIIRELPGTGLPGMGYPLTSEFMRNLGWSGFKPDRHIKRLFDLWDPHPDGAKAERVAHLQALIGVRSRELTSYLTYSLRARSYSPPGRTLTEIDNLVWLLGAYVERKGRESATEYLR